MWCEVTISCYGWSPDSTKIAICYVLSPNSQIPSQKLPPKSAQNPLDNSIAFCYAKCMQKKTPINRGSIWLQPGAYNALKQGKQQYETQVDGKIDWGGFLLFLLGLYIASQIGKGNERSKK